MVQMTKNLVHSFYHILYQPKGVPTPRDNFSGTGGSLQGLLWKSFQHNKYCPNPFNLDKIVFADYFSCFHFFWIKSIHSKRKTCPYIFVTPFFGLKPKVLCIIIYFVIYLYYHKNDALLGSEIDCLVIFRAKRFIPTYVLHYLMIILEIL